MAAEVRALKGLRIHYRCCVAACEKKTEESEDRDTDQMEGLSRRCPQRVLYDERHDRFC